MNNMFGFTIVRKQTIKDLNWNLKQALSIIAEKDKKIEFLLLENNNLESKIHSLESERNTVKKEPQLLVDVTEKPLIVEKRKRVVKKTSDATTQGKKVVRKTDE